ncbi:MAG: putative transporter small subunit [Pseudomonas sp.]
MQTFIYGAYILIWPLITLGMLGLIAYAVLRDFRDAKRNDTDMV